MKSQRERDEQKKRQKLADMEDQVKQGKLKIRKMTAKERADNPARPRNKRAR